MYVAINKDIVMFRTPFSEGRDLVQKFSGVACDLTSYNNPVNFTESGLVHNEKWDGWHIDDLFAVCTDEPSPCVVNGYTVGANHGFFGAVSIHIAGHGKTAADIGSVWQDGEGTKWILVAAEEETLQFLSENIGGSRDQFAFKSAVASGLTYVGNGVHTDFIPADGETWRSELFPIIRHTVRRVVAYMADGSARVVDRALTCERAEIQEEYEIVNPASMAEAICKNRPQGGYERGICEAVGDPMIRVRVTYRIEADGTVLCDFAYKKLTGVHFERLHAVMFQERLDTYGGGVFRLIPNVLPFETPEGTFDFSRPVSTAPGAFPESKMITPEYWADPAAPPDRMVDFFRDRDGADRLGFACGFLPVFDGERAKRRRHLSCAANIVRTRKGYLYFMWGEIESARGIAYKKYFVPDKNRASAYRIPCGGKTWIYADLPEQGSLSVETEGEVSLIEKTKDLAVSIEDGRVLLSGRGSAVFCQLCQRA